MTIPPGQLPDTACCCTETGSKIAKGGFKEEHLVCDDFATSTSLRTKFCQTFGIDNSGDTLRFSKVPGTTKTDCISNCSSIRLQIKKGKKGQSGQVDRHWVDTISNMLPCLMPIKHMLKGLCEYDLKPDGTIDKANGRKLLTLQNYTQSELDFLVKVLDDNKRDIIETVLLGTDTVTKPTHMAYVSYDKTKRHTLKIWRMSDIVNSLIEQPSSISKKGATFSVCDAISFQRKGGDGGKKSSNQLQAKIVPSKIIVSSECPVVTTYYS